jgi:D-alanyl-D-alanine carboxypeptidase/glycerophosphoryl diester phosphodiesterase
MVLFGVQAFMMPGLAAAEAPVLPRAHSHNDYEQARPLLDALDNGFCSVEADVFLRDHALLIGHTLLDLKPDRTLQKLYLDPLRERVRANKGFVFSVKRPFHLLIDVKSEAGPTYAALAKVLAEYDEILTSVRDGKTTPKAVSVIMSGNCDRQAIADAKVRHCFIDGRPKDLDAQASAALIPWISANWNSQFSWKGAGPMSADERVKLHAYVAKAHGQGRQVRYWAAPDNAESWAIQHAAGVDFINTDQLTGLREFLEKQPPEVTARGWAVLNGTNGKLVGGKNADEPMKAASTTKVMTARVVLRLAADDPKVLDEIVTFSKLADDTSGSTADVKVGERLPVRPLLYGLLLPSGNDAGNALAEHFNGRFAPPDDELLQLTGLDPAKWPTRINFLAEMNREARRLGLTKTVYRSTFGDGGTANQFTTSPHDLARLTRQTMFDFELFRSIVRTPTYDTSITKPDGTTRVAQWKNTNSLLGKPGYDGVKTGTTSQAGSCLVSSARRGDDYLIVVVLGSKTNADRYADTEALCAWAWAEIREPR